MKIFAEPELADDLTGNIRNPALFYPGSGRDFGPAMCFLEGTNISTIVYCGYTLSGLGDGSAAHYKRIVPGHFGGLDGFKDIAPKDLGARGWGDFWHKSKESRHYAKPEGCFGFWSIFEYKGKQKCLVFLKTEALGTYRVLWGKHGATPACVYIKEHGFGQNWTQFSGEKGLYQEAKHNPPEFLCAACDPEWPGYTEITDGSDFGCGRLYRLTPHD